MGAVVGLVIVFVDAWEEGGASEMMGLVVVVRRFFGVGEVVVSAVVRRFLRFAARAPLAVGMDSASEEDAEEEEEDDEDEDDWGAGLSAERA